MKKSYQLLCVLLTFLVFSAKSFAQNNLAAGDLAFVSILRHKLWLSCLILLITVTAVAQNYTPTTFTDPVFTTINNTTGAITGGAGIGLISLRSALKAADNLGGTHTVTLLTGNYILDGTGTYTYAGPVTVTVRTILLGITSQNITINGNGPANTFITMAVAGRDRMFLINPVGTTNSPVISMSGITFQNAYLTSDAFGGGAIYAGGGSAESLTLTNCAFLNNTTPAGNGGGAAVKMDIRGNLTIDNCTFTNNISNDADGGAVLDIIYNSSLGTSYGTANITNSTFTGNSVNFPGAGTANGGALEVSGQGGVSAFNATITNNTFINNSTDGLGGALVTNNGPNLSILQVNFNRFVGNTAAAGAASGALHFVESSGNVNANNNWWGCNTGPTAGPCDRAGGDVAGGGTLTLTKWLQLKTTASASPICLSATSNITASFLTNSANEIVTPANVSRLISLPVTWTSTLGGLSSQQTTIQAAGTATAIFTANATAGPATVNAQVDNVPSSETSPARANITVSSNNTTAAPSSNPTVCINTAISPNITIATTGATGIGAPTGLPAGVSASFAANTITISGTPTTTAGSPFSYSIPLTGGCGTVNATGTITVNAVNTAGAPSSNPTVCINTAISPNITIATTGATGIGAPTGLPAGVTASFAANTITISGTPTTTVGSPFNYSIPLTGGCGTVNATGTITVRPNNTAGAPSTNPTVCVNTAISPNITIATTGATGIGSPTGLPAGVTASFGANTITISGTPTTAVGSPFNYSIPLTGGCGSVNATGTITVTAGSSITSNPSTSTACSGLAVSFTGAASNQTSLAWQESTDIGFTTPTALTNTGIYSNTSTATLNISDNSGVSGRYYRLVGINSNGCPNANSTGALLTATAPTLPGTTSATNTIGTNNNLSYDASCGIVSKVVPLAGTPVSGIVTSNVWVEGAVPTYGGTPFVQRHYQITPAAGSTATVTLYFSQTEFDNFNAVSSVDLPTGSGDAAGKANLRISKFNGSSSGGGLPGSYSSGGSLIDPADANIIFNATLSHWEVTFDVSGFSGFFVQTATFVLPVNLISFSAQKENNDVKLKWQTADEVNNIGFHVERRNTLGDKWDILSFVNAKGKNASYDFTDNTPLSINYYRLRQIDNDGKETLSKVVSVSMDSKGSLKVYSNPVSNVLTIETIRTDDYQIFNLLGQQVLYGKTMQQIDVSVLPQGAYVIKVGTEQVRFVKQ